MTDPQPLSDEEITEFGAPSVIPVDPSKARIELERIREERKALGRFLRGDDLHEARRQRDKAVALLKRWVAIKYGNYGGIRADTDAFLRELEKP